MYKVVFVILFLITLSVTGRALPVINLIKPTLYSTTDTFFSHKHETPNQELTEIENKTPEHFKYAIKLNIPVELVQNLELFRVLTEWYGTRYLFGGSTKRGTDCSGFTQQVMKEVYDINLERVVGPQYNQCRPVEKEELQQGDLVFFHTTRAGLSHVGLYLGENKFIHASSTKGVIVDDLNSKYYSKAYRKAGRILSE